jgi:uncharacterized pyridoxamine 5'-phosphate oxidase family protein
VILLSWKKLFDLGNELILSTSSLNGKPHSIVVISAGFIEGKLLINACQTKKSLKNINENSFVSVVSMNKKEYYSIEGTAKIYSFGKYFDLSIKRNQGPKVKKSIVVSVKKVFDLNKVKRIY